ncbi:bromodomain 4 [Tasmannia lanceolata]|uniref:bromodomain 4 n=1 Tax=Tasmannia lanceolata TaxID=3420 RepID=UPI0040642413
MMEEAIRWGTWEELLLGGAVLRHGTRAWEAVASELRTRTLCPSSTFSPKDCKAKYEDLQERFYGCTAWFEELRKQRVAELKRELEKSEDSIGSLQSKLESLMAVRESESTYDCDTESTLPAGNIDVTEFPSKEGLSAGSFTEETTRIRSPNTQIPEMTSAQVEETKAEISEESEKLKERERDSVIVRGSVKKKRGKRKRKGCKEVKEGSAGESDVFSCVNVVRDKEESTGGCDRDVGFSGGSNQEEVPDLAVILESMVAEENVSVFGRRLEKQKKARYKKMIRRHVDLGTIRWRISEGSISSSRELFRDVLLLCNNALVFYPKNSPEYRSAISLRNSATKRFRQKIEVKAVGSSTRSSNRTTSSSGEKAAHLQSPVVKKGVGRPPNGKPGAPVKGRKKRARRR